MKALRRSFGRSTSSGGVRARVVLSGLSAGLVLAAALLACGGSGSRAARSTEGSSAAAAPQASPASPGFWGQRIRTERDVPYGKDPKQTMDLYLQRPRFRGEAGATGGQAAPEPRPTLLWMHGGGWMGGDKSTELYMFLAFLQRGWNVVNANYRIGAGTAPEAVDDALCALEWVVDSAQARGFDLRRIVVSGQSSGGHLALVDGLPAARKGRPCAPPADFRVAAVVSWYGIPDIQAEDRFRNRVSPGSNFVRSWVGGESRVAEISKRFSPVELVDSTAPPILQIKGDSDRAVPYAQARAFSAELDSLGVTHEFLTIPGGGHGHFYDGEYQKAFRTEFAFLARVASGD